MSPDYPMTEIIAAREFEMRSGTGTTIVLAQVGQPAQMPDNENWYCPWVVIAADVRLDRYAAGVDSMQALLLGLTGLRVDLDYLSGREGKLTYLGEKDLMMEMGKGLWV